jgi:hypothetical protein
VFRAAVWTAIILSAIGLFAAAQAPSALVTALLAAIPAVIVFAVFLMLTNQFIPLVMIDHDLALIPAWKRFYTTLREEWKQVGLFVIAKVVLGMAVGILVLLAVLVLALPAGLIAIAVFLLEPSQAVMIGLAVAGLGVGLLVILYVFQVPAQTYLRYYTICVYQKLDV